MGEILVGKVLGMMKCVVKSSEKDALNSEFGQKVIKEDKDIYQAITEVKKVK